MIAQSCKHRLLLFMCSWGSRGLPTCNVLNRAKGVSERGKTAQRAFVAVHLPEWGEDETSE